MSKNARIWEPWEDEIILTSKVPIKTLVDVLNRSYDAISTRKALLRRRHLCTKLEIEQQAHEEKRRQRRASALEKELQKKTEGLDFSAQKLYILKQLLKGGFNIDPLLNPKYSLAQLKELDACIRAKIDISWMTTHNPQQIVEIRLGKQHGVDTSCYENPAFCAECMRQIRYGLEAKLPVQVYASLFYNCGQMHILRDCLRNRIPTKIIANPKYSVLRMKIIRSAVKAGLDTTTFEDPNIPDAQAKAIYTDLYNKYRAVYPTLSKIPKLEKFNLENLDDAGEPFVVHCGLHEYALEFLDEMKNLGYSWNKIISKPNGKLGGLSFYCNPKERTLYADQNRPKGDCFVSYASIKHKQSPLRREDWVSCSKELPKYSGMFLCMVQNSAGETKERFVEFNRQRQFCVEGTVLSWKPHFTREELATYKKENCPETEIFPAQAIFATMG